MTGSTARRAPNRLPLGVVLGLSMANLPIAALSVAVLVYLPPYFAGHLMVPDGRGGRRLDGDPANRYPR